VPQLDAREFYQEMVHPLTGRQRYPGWPFRISPGPTQHHRTVSPTLGQHNAEVLKNIGVTEAELAELTEHQVIGQRLLNA
jgi:crotonobetainyl-CoA:carnitine CoA-transferase CaiB-like acyl-CoA transferase